MGQPSVVITRVQLERVGTLPASTGKIMWTWLAKAALTRVWPQRVGTLPASAGIPSTTNTSCNPWATIPKV